MEKTTQCIVEITKYSKKGVAQGFAKEYEKPIEVRGSVLEEKVLADIIKRKKGVHEARLVSVVQTSPFRITPRCIHSGTCGGCSWQAFDYLQQCLYKENNLKSLFQKYLTTAIYYPLIKMDHPWAFRNKMEFSFYQNKEGEKSLGLIVAGTKGRVLQLRECHVTSPWMMEVLQAVKGWWDELPLQAYHRLKNEGTLQNLTLREGKATNEKMAMLTISGTPCAAFSHDALQGFKQALLKVCPDMTSIVLQIKHTKPKMQTQYHEMVIHGRAYIHEKLSISYPDGKLRELRFKISPTSFFQPNPLQARELFAKALQMVNPQPSWKVLDLYCGSGVVGMIFSFLVREVIGIELNPYATFDAEVNVEYNQVNNLTVLQGDVEKVLSEKAIKDVDLVIIDPPRAGVGQKAIEHIIAIAPKEILYISCNPYTQIEDVHLFVEKGYSVKAIQPVDQFPHSPHLENIVVLQRKGDSSALISP